MNWEQSKCSLCYQCLYGALLAPLTLKQHTMGSKTTFHTFLFLNSVEFHRISLENTRLISTKWANCTNLTEERNLIVLSPTITQLDTAYCRGSPPKLCRSANTKALYPTRRFSCWCCWWHARNKILPCRWSWAPYTLYRPVWRHWWRWRIDRVRGRWYRCWRRRRVPAWGWRRLMGALCSPRLTTAWWNYPADS